MFNVRRSALTAMVLVTGFAGSALAQDKPLAKVDGQPIMASEVQAMLAATGQAGDAADAGELRKALDLMVDMRIIANQAAKDGIQNSDEFKRRLEASRQQLLINLYVKTKVSDVITDAQLKARYDAEIAKLPEELRARHILVKTKDEADAILKQLAGGGDFAKLAEEKSQDPGSAKNGGDLGYFALGDMVKPFEDAAMALKPGEITKTPIETQFGFHVIKLEDKRKQPPPAFDDVKDQLRKSLVGTAVKEKLDELKKTAKVEIDEAALTAK